LLSTGLAIVRFLQLASTFGSCALLVRFEITYILAYTISLYLLAFSDQILYLAEIEFEEHVKLIADGAT
jgi:hypothetical protein